MKGATHLMINVSDCIFPDDFSVMGRSIRWGRLTNSGHKSGENRRDFRRVFLTSLATWEAVEDDNRHTILTDGESCTGAIARAYIGWH